MLELMRKHARNWIMKILLGTIIVVFIFYFGSTTWRHRANILVTIEGKTITLTEYQKAYRDLIELYRQQTGGQLNDEMLKSLNLKQQVIEQLIFQEILANRGKKLGLGISDEEIIKLITSYPIFQRDGVFSQQLYQQMLRHQGLTPEDFELLQKKSITAARLKDLIQEAALITDEEAYNFFRSRNDLINLTYIRISPEKFKNYVNVSDENLEKFLKEHASEFRVPDQFQVKYLLFMARDYGEKIKVSEDEILETFKRTKGKSSRDKDKPTPSERIAIEREIRISKGMKMAYAEAKKAHDTIYQQENFESYASSRGIRVETTSSFTLQDVPKPLREINNVSNILAKLQKDDISGVLSIKDGFCIVKMVARKPGYIPSLSEIKGKVREKFVHSEARQLAQKEAEKIINEMKNGKSLVQIGKARGFSIEETGFFIILAAPPASFGNSLELSRVASSLSPKKPYAEEPLLSRGDYIVLELKDRKPADERTFQEQKQILKSILKMVKSNEMISSWLQHTKERLEKEGRIKYHPELKEL
ncbi:MAG: SurA N-terminal domain-containing protein [Syntrophales bacterium]|nr:SurA N-terminal domain-containing protein [Syntrophales bacterium]